MPRSFLSKVGIFSNAYKSIKPLFFPSSEDFPISVLLPKNIYARTNIFRRFFAKEKGRDLNIVELLEAVYLKFINDSIVKYQPERIFQQINRSYGYNEYLIIHDKDSYLKIKKRDEPMMKINFSISKSDAELGSLLLEELECLYGHSPSLEQLIATLWINFVEEYKVGKNAIDQLYNIVEEYVEGFDNYEGDDDLDED